MLYLIKAPTGNTNTFNRVHVPNPLLLLLYGHAASKIRYSHHQQTPCIAMRNQVRSELKELQAPGGFFFCWGFLADHRETSAQVPQMLTVLCLHSSCICTQPLAGTCLHPPEGNRLWEDARVCLGTLRSNTCSGLLMFKQLCWICQRVSDRVVKNWSLSKQPGVIYSNSAVIIHTIWRAA